MTGNLIAFISAVIISFVMTPWARKLAIKVGALDIPKESRKIHNKPMPYFGGLAIYVSIIACMFVYMPHTSTNYHIMAGFILSMFLIPQKPEAKQNINDRITDTIILS